MQIRKYEAGDKQAVVTLSLSAWAPVFASLKEEMDPAIYQHFYPDWRQCQKESVESVCDDPNAKVFVAIEEGEVAGFVAIYFRSETFGEIYMIAVDPAFQKRQIGRALTDFASRWMCEQGIVVAMVETGNDPGHAPARKLYEKSGYQLLPAARYFKYLPAPSEPLPAG